MSCGSGTVSIFAENKLNSILEVLDDESVLKIAGHVIQEAKSTIFKQVLARDKKVGWYIMHEISLEIQVPGELV